MGLCFTGACMTDYIVYGTSVCPACNNTKQLLESKNKTYEYVDVSTSKEAQAKVIAYWLEQERRPTVPLIYDNVKNQFVGSYEQLTQYFNQ